MAPRLRIESFDRGPPPSDRPLLLLCESEGENYVLPFPCEWRDGAWYNKGRAKPLAVRVMGWRAWFPAKRVGVLANKKEK